MNYRPLILLLLLPGVFLFTNGKTPKKDYLKYRENYTQLNCGKSDSLTAIHSIEKLLSIDSGSFTKNFHFYYNDLAWAYYIYYAHTNDKLYLRKAVENYHKVVDITKDYWDIAFCYVYLGDCENGMFYLQSYIANTKKKHRIDEEQIERLKAKCK